MVNGPPGRNAPTSATENNSEFGRLYKNPLGRARSVPFLSKVRGVTLTGVVFPVKWVTGVSGPPAPQNAVKRVNRDGSAAWYNGPEIPLRVQRTWSRHRLVKGHPVRAARPTRNGIHKITWQHLPRLGVQKGVVGETVVSPIVTQTLREALWSKARNVIIELNRTV